MGNAPGLCARDDGGKQVRSSRTRPAGMAFDPGATHRHLRPLFAALSAGSCPAQAARFAVSLSTHTHTHTTHTHYWSRWDERGEPAAPGPGGCVRPSVSTTCRKSFRRRVAGRPHRHRRATSATTATGTIISWGATQCTELATRRRRPASSILYSILTVARPRASVRPSVENTRPSV